MAFADLVEAADRVAQDKLGGEEVTYTPSVGSPVVVVGIFDENYILAKGDAEAGVETIGPAIFVRLEDLPEDPRTAAADPRVTVRGVVYRVRERIPDGMGGIALGLRRVT